MSYTMEDFRRDFTIEHLSLLTPNDLRNAVPIEKLLEAVPAEKRLEGLSPEDRLEGLSDDELQRLLAEAKKKLGSG